MFFLCDMHVSTPLGDFVVLDRVYHSCIVTFIGNNVCLDFVIFYMVDFDIILRMILLSP